MVSEPTFDSGGSGGGSDTTDGTTTSTSDTTPTESGALLASGGTTLSQAEAEKLVASAQPDSTEEAVSKRERAPPRSADAPGGSEQIGGEGPRGTATEAKPRVLGFGPRPQRGADVEGQPVRVEYRRQTETERFGDIVIAAGGTRVEDVLNAGGDLFSAKLRDITAPREEAGPNQVILESAIANALESRGDTDLAAAVESTERALLRGGGEILNVPATAAGLKEGVEFLAFGATETAAGRGEQFAQASAQAGAAAAEVLVGQAKDKPVQTAAFLGGSLLTSTAVIRGASKVSRPAGRATAFAIQPGEEIAGTAGFRATQATAGTRAAERFFPQKEPLIFSEEAAIRALKGEAGRLKRGSVAIKSRAGAGGGGLKVEVKQETKETAEEALLEEELRRMERAQARRAKQQRAKIRSRFDVERNPLRSRAHGREIEFAREPEMVREIVGRSEIESKAESDVLSRVEPQLFYESQQASPLDQRLDQQQRSRTAAGSRPDIRGRTDARSEVRSRADTETELDTEARSEAEFLSETEAETELEREFETELEFLAETEIEAEFERGKQRREKSPFLTGDTFEKTFTSPVASPEEVLTGLSILDDT